MATVEFGELTCVKKDDTFGKDEVNIFLNGKFVSGPHKLAKGDSPRVGGKFDFAVRAVIVLKEVNGNNVTILGMQDAEASPARLEDRIAVFHDHPGSDYHLAYTLDSRFK